MTLPDETTRDDADDVNRHRPATKGLRDRLAAHHTRARKRAATKLTADDVAASLAARRQRRAARKAAVEADDVTRSGSSRVVGVILGAAVLTLGIGISVTGSQFRADSAANGQTISALEGELETNQALLDPTVQQDRGKALKAQISEAHTKAEAVARLQQEFSALIHQSTTTPALGNGTPNAASLQVVAHRRKLAPLFSADSYVVKEPIAYTPGTADDVAADQVDPRYPWFVRYEQGEDGHSPTGSPVASEPSASTWTVESLAPSTSGDPTMTDVTWLCKDSTTGDLLAWATASFSSERHDFNRLTVGTTSTGDRYTPMAAEN